MRPTFAEVNLSNLKFNYLNIRKKCNVKIMAVVKADAYGHGAAEVVKALNSLIDKKPEYFAVALPEEGAELCEQKISQPILVFEPVTANQAELIFKYRLIPTVFTEAQLKILKEAKAKFFKRNSKKSTPIKVHIKIDTGMNRLGINHKKAFSFIQKLSTDDNFLIDGIYTHFATSDEKDKSFANYQLNNFKTLLKKLNEAKINHGLVHAANSGAILDMPEAYFDLVRPGISLYGYYPSLETTESIKLKPVMALYSEVASVKEIEPEEIVSYGRLFRAAQKTKIAAVPLGYADGFNRNLTGKAKAIIKGKFYPQVGRVTMDRIMFDVGNDNIKVGDKIILLGKNKNLKIDAWDWSRILNTIPYEITCAVSKRVPRVFKD